MPSDSTRFTSVIIVLLRDDLPPVLGTLCRELLRFVEPTDRQCLNVLLERLVRHVLYGLFHGE